MRPFSIFRLGAILLVSIQEEIDDAEIVRLTKELSEEVREVGAKAVILDLSDVEVVDTFLAENVCRLASTMKLCEARTVIAGLGAPAIAALEGLGMSFGSGFVFALDAEHALERLGYVIVPAQGQ